MPNDQELRGRLITGADVLSRLEDATRDALTWIGNKGSAISTVGLVFLVIAALALIWAWALMKAPTRLGPTEVGDLTTDAKDVPLTQLSAEFRRVLAQIGLSPPAAVPLGSPQANLITAIGAAGPQGAAVSTVLSVLPKPPQPAQYKVSAVLSCPDGGAAAATSWWTVDYTLQPQSQGAPQLACTPPRLGYDATLTRAALEIYQRIARSLPDVFPAWVRWGTPESLEAYLAGLNQRESDWDAAAAAFKTAVDTSPFNALAALQLANVNEQRARAADGWDRVFFRAQALARYRAIAVQWPTVVAARYRASVVSGELATSYGQLDSTDERDAVRAIVPFPGFDATTTEAYVKRLRDFAERESSATTQLLRRPYTIARLRRLRNQFEATGAERRALLSVVRTSRQCVAMRRLNARRPSWRKALMVGYRVLRVQMLTWADVPWEARYNAACFDALRLTGGVRGAWRRRVIDRALRNLNLAICESGGKLTRTLIVGDPDMAYFSNGGQPYTPAP